MSLRSLIVRRVKQFRQLVSEDSMVLLGQLHTERIRSLGKLSSFHQAEFKVFSQWGEDGIIQYLIQRVPIVNQAFVEFGVGDYCESNTRFLLMNDNWAGLVIDGSADHIARIRADSIWFRYGLKTSCSFITKDNINSLIESGIARGDIGLLSIDIDGNDWWVWQAIEVVQPRIVVCEYNSLWGNDRAVTIPYREDFCYSKAHYCGRYCGASLPALRLLGSRKGYDFVGCNSNGANAFFVRKDLCQNVTVLHGKDGFVRSRFYQTYDRSGRLTEANHAETLKLLADMPLWDVQAGKEIKVADLI